jgi:hypothetical protein
MRNAFLLLLVLLGSIASTAAQVSIGVTFPGASMYFNLPAYPQLVRVPDYPVYYAPDVDANFFFYDGMYWLYQTDNWYTSTWYNGPWALVARDAVPLYLLRVPVRYYRQPPYYFYGARSEAPPRWNEYWGREWSQRHNGWDRWNRSAAPAPAPLPRYQRSYSEQRYPDPPQQYQLQERSYRYEPRDNAVRQQAQVHRQYVQPGPPQRGPGGEQRGRSGQGDRGPR